MIQLNALNLTYSGEVSLLVDFEPRGRAPEREGDGAWRAEGLVLLVGL